MAVLLADDEPSTAGQDAAGPDVLQDRCDGPGALVVGEALVRQVHISGVGAGVIGFDGAAVGVGEVF